MIWVLILVLNVYFFAFKDTWLGSVLKVVPLRITWAAACMSNTSRTKQKTNYDGLIRRYILELVKLLLKLVIIEREYHHPVPFLKSQNYISTWYFVENWFNSILSFLIAQSQLYLISAEKCYDEKPMQAIWSQSAAWTKYYVSLSALSRLIFYRLCHQLVFQIRKHHNWCIWCNILLSSRNSMMD